MNPGHSVDCRAGVLPVNERQQCRGCFHLAFHRPSWSATTVHLSNFLAVGRMIRFRHQFGDSYLQTKFSHPSDQALKKYYYFFRPSVCPSLETQFKSCHALPPCLAEIGEVGHILTPDLCFVNFGVAE